MSIELSLIENRRNKLQACLRQCEETHTELKERLKMVKQEIANAKGAILELERLLDEAS